MGCKSSKAACAPTTAAAEEAAQVVDLVEKAAASEEAPVLGSEGAREDAALLINTWSDDVEVVVPLSQEVASTESPKQQNDYAAVAEAPVVEEQLELQPTLAQEPETSVREVVSDGALKPQAKTLVAKASAPVLRPVPLGSAEGSSAAAAPPVVAQASEELLMGETRTVVIQATEERPREPDAPPSTSNSALGLLGHGLELMKKTLADATAGHDLDDALKPKASSYPPICSPRPEDVPLPRLLGRTGLRTAPTAPLLSQKLVCCSNEETDADFLLTTRLRQTFPPPRAESVLALDAESLPERAAPGSSRVPLPFERQSKYGREDSCFSGADEVFYSCIGRRSKY